VPVGALNQIYGAFSFKRVMAKTPTIANWSYTGVANSAHCASGVVTTSGAVNVGDSGFDVMGLSAAQTTGGTFGYFQYTADSGW
jgi:hypothetical protein